MIWNEERFNVACGMITMGMIEIERGQGMERGEEATDRGTLLLEYSALVGRKL